MCILLLSREHPSYDLIILSNRDEYFDRPTEILHRWPDSDIIGGRDSLRGGTWLAITSSGHFAALTNYREAASENISPRSRGLLPTTYLHDPTKPVTAAASEYAGFSLLFGKLTQSLSIFSNRPTIETTAITTDVCELSNTEAASSWPKTTLGRQLLRKAIAQSGMKEEEELIKDLLNVLSCNTLTSQTLEGLKDSIFIPELSLVAGSSYGTRQQTVILVKNESIKIVERTIYSHSENKNPEYVEVTLP